MWSWQQQDHQQRQWKGRGATGLAVVQPAAIAVLRATQPNPIDADLVQTSRPGGPPSCLSTVAGSGASHRWMLLQQQQQQQDAEEERAVGTAAVRSGDGGGKSTTTWRRYRKALGWLAWTVRSSCPPPACEPSSVGRSAAASARSIRASALRLRLCLRCPFHHPLKKELNGRRDDVQPHMGGGKMHTFELHMGEGDTSTH